MGPRMDLVVLIDRPGFTATGTSRLLKQADAVAVTEADDLLARAQARDRLMLEQTLTAYEDARTRGHRSGAADAEQEWAARLAAAHAARHITLHSLAPTLVEIVLDAVGAVLQGADRQQFVAAALAAVHGRLQQARWAKLRVHPAQVDTAHAALADSNAIGRALVTVVADPALDIDDCVFETDAGIADASLGVQLAAIRTAIEAAIASLGTGEASPSA